MARFLITGDWHLTDHPMDEYRWSVLDWTHRQLHRYECDALWVLGDLTHHKDNHPAKLVNRMVEGLDKLRAVCPVFVLMGNHDYHKDPTTPFFSFLWRMEGIDFITKPTDYSPRAMFGVKALALPHTRQWRKDWEKDTLTKGYDLILIHQTVTGARTESGKRMTEGVPRGLFREKYIGRGCKVVSGDIHVPQRIGNVRYVGAPHPINHGDTYGARALLYDSTKASNLQLRTIERHTVKKAIVRLSGPAGLRKSGLEEGDIARVVVDLPRQDYYRWAKVRKQIENQARGLGVTLSGIELRPAEDAPSNGRVRLKEKLKEDAPETSLAKYAKKKGISGEDLERGLSFLGQVHKPKSRHSVSWRPEQVTVQGFRSFGSAQTLTFGPYPSFCFVSGENHVHPEIGENGTGKSSLWDAVCWVLFNKTARGLHGPDVTHWSDDYLTIVSLVILKDGERYTISRTRSPISLSVRRGEADPQPASEQDVQDLIGMDYDLFLRTVLMGQFGEFFFDLGPAQKLEVFSEALGLTVWEDAADLARRSAKVARSKREALDGEINRLQGSLTTLKGVQAEAHSRALEHDKAVEGSRRQRVAGLEKAQVLAALADGSFRQARKLLDKAEDARDKARRSLLEADDSREAARKAYDRARTEIAAYDLERAKKDLKQLEAGRKRCEACGKPISAAEYNAKLRSARDKVKSLAEVEKRIRTLRAQKDRALRDAEEAVKAADRVLGAAEDRLRDATAKMVRARGEKSAADRAVKDAQQALDELLAPNPYARQVEDAQDRIEKARHSFERAKRDRDAAAADEDAGDRWAQAFKDVRLWLVESALRELEVEVNNGLIQLGLVRWRVRFDIERENRSGGVTKGFSVMISSPASKGRDVPWKGWCGGETQRLRVAGAVGLASLLSSRKGVKVPIEVWDEPTAHVSGRGTEDLVSYFAARSRSSGKNIWLVDHRSLSFGGFDREVRVRLGPDGSELAAVGPEDKE